MADGYSPNYVEQITRTWTPVIPRSTITTLSRNYYIRVGNIVYATARFAISDSNSYNDYLEGYSLPYAGMPGFGSWMDNNSGSAPNYGLIIAAPNFNFWFVGSNGAEMTFANKIGHDISINITYLIP